MLVVANGSFKTCRLVAPGVICQTDGDRCGYHKVSSTSIGQHRARLKSVYWQASACMAITGHTETRIINMMNGWKYRSSGNYKLSLLYTQKQFVCVILSVYSLICCRYWKCIIAKKYKVRNTIKHISGLTF